MRGRENYGLPRSWPGEPRSPEDDGGGFEGAAWLEFELLEPPPPPELRLLELSLPDPPPEEPLLLPPPPPDAAPAEPLLLPPPLDAPALDPDPPEPRLL